MWVPWIIARKRSQNLNLISTKKKLVNIAGKISQKIDLQGIFKIKKNQRILVNFVEADMNGGKINAQLLTANAESVVEKIIFSLFVLAKLGKCISYKKKKTKNYIIQ